MVHIRLKRYPQGAVCKLQVRSVGPFKIIKRNSLNVYVVDLLPTMRISSTFNIEDLVAFQGTTYTLSSLLPNHPDSPDLSFDS